MLRTIDLTGADEDDSEAVFYEILLLIEEAVEHDISEGSIRLALIRALDEMSSETDIH